MKKILIFLAFMLYSENNKSQPAKIKTEIGKENQIKSKTAKKLEYYEYIGFGIKEAFETLSYPSQIFPLRNSDPSLDDVVFYYENKNIYLVFYQNRVWNIRFDKNYKSRVFGIKIGDSVSSIKRNRTIKTFSFVSEDKNQIIYDLPYLKFDLRLKILLKNKKAYDIYIYRSDF